MRWTQHRGAAALAATVAALVAACDDAPTGPASRALPGPGLALVAVHAAQLRQPVLRPCGDGGIRLTRAAGVDLGADSSSEAGAPVVMPAGK